MHLLLGFNPLSSAKTHADLAGGDRVELQIVAFVPTTTRTHGQSMGLLL